MISLALVYVAGRKFFDLAEEYHKNKWGYAILGSVIYLSGLFLFGFLLGLYAVLSNKLELIEEGNFLLNLLSIPFSALIVFGVYSLIKKNWSKANKVNEVSELLDENFE